MSEVNGAVFHEDSGFVPSVLMSPDARKRIISLATALPPAIRWTMTEHRLAPNDDQVDFLAATTSTWGGHALASMLGHEARAVGLSNHLPFLRNWATPSSLLNRDVEAIWFEYDMIPGGEHVPVPFVPFSVDPTYHRSTRQRVASPLHVRTLAATALESLYGRPWDQDILNTLERCATRLPALGRVLHVAAAPHRGHQDLRIYVHLPVTEIIPWLQRIEWPGSHSLATQAIEVTGLRIAMTGVHIDVGPSVRPYFAVERNLHTNGQCGEAHDVIQRLCALDACDPAKGRAAAASVGRVDWPHANSPWPLVVQRDLCIKIMTAGRGLEAKAYLGFRPDVRVLDAPTEALVPQNRSNMTDN